MKTRYENLIVTLAFFAGVHYGRAQGTAFTYQGRLNDGRNQANGNYDLAFTLYGANSSGAIIAGPVTNSATAVSNGLFSTVVDFGPGIFAGTSNWLAIAVRTNGGSTFTVLSPRQQLTPMPYAITAGNLSGTVSANQLSGTVPSAQIAGTYLSAVTMNNAGNSFIGNGSGLSGVNATLFGGMSVTSFWQTGGNTGTTAGANYLGTADSQPLELHVHGTRALRIEPTASIPNLIGGYIGNMVISNADGATIAGGGKLSAANVIAAECASIAGGYGNTAVGGEAFIGGGWNNYAAGGSSVISGGAENLVTQNIATIAGGASNTNTGYASTISGGTQNQISTGGYATIAGGILNYAYGAYDSIGGGELNTANSSYVTIAGGDSNVANGRYSFIGGGATNTASGEYSVVVGGSQNSSGWASIVGGGLSNSASGSEATVTGGNNNTAAAADDVIGGGSFNYLNAGNGVIAGGNYNTNNGGYAAIGGGYENSINAQYAFIGGGLNNVAGFEAVVAGGWQNMATNGNDTVGGGDHNTASGGRSTVAGGTQSTASGYYSTIGGGYFNIATNNGATIGGGVGNFVGGLQATIAGGSANTNIAYLGTIGGGIINLTTGDYSTVAGGQLNSALNTSATVSGGQQNVASGYMAVIPGGMLNNASGDYSFAAGTAANAIHKGAFVWADSQSGLFNSTANNQFDVRASGGVLFTSGTSGLGNETVSWTPGSGGWSFSSDRNLKDRFENVNAETVLDKVIQLPITEWSYQGYAQRHIGAMAQDFHALFPLNDNDKVLNDADLHGVELAAIKGLNQKLNDKNDEIQGLKVQNELLAKRLSELERTVQSLTEIK